MIVLQFRQLASHTLRNADTRPPAKPFKSLWVVDNMMVVASASHGSTVIQVVGDGNTIVRDHPYLHLTRYLNRLQVREGADWLSPYTRSTKLVGRQRELQELQALLRSPRRILVRVIAGSGGRGKTRLALELCEWATAQGWSAGFASHTELSRFFSQHNLENWGWKRPTLMVIDYAALYAEQLTQWIEELADRPEPPTQPLRLLLLERRASLRAGWCHDVFAAGGYGAGSKRALLDPGEPVELEPLSSREDRLALIEDLLGKISPHEHDATSLECSLLPRLSSKWGGDPLYLMMVALSSRQSSGTGPLVVKRTEMALGLARREMKRIEDLAVRKNMDPDLAIHLMACVTLSAGMERDTFEKFVDEEKVAVRRSSGGDAARLATLLQREFPAPEGVAPISPDLIGEAFVLSSREFGRESVMRCYARNRNAVVRTLIQCAQDFSPQKAEPLQWLEEIVEAIGDDEESLAALGDAMPVECAILDHIRLGVAQRLAKLRHRTLD